MGVTTVAGAGVVAVAASVVADSVVDQVVAVEPPVVGNLVIRK